MLMLQRIATIALFFIIKRSAFYYISLRVLVSKLKFKIVIGKVVDGLSSKINLQCSIFCGEYQKVMGLNQEHSCEAENSRAGIFHFLQGT